MKEILVPQKLAENLNEIAEDRAWLEQLPGVVQELQQRWSLTLDPPFEEEASCSWVATCTREDGSAAVLKVGMPHMEALDEVKGLLFWNGDPTAYVWEHDLTLNGFLLERCIPGTVLRKRPEEEQDIVIAQMLRRLWRMPDEPHDFRPLSEMTAAWGAEALEAKAQWPDEGFANEGLRLFEELPKNAPHEALLATDLHAGNVLEAEREPWLVIDPKPFVGDTAYDATQHLLNCMERLQDKPEQTIRRFSDLLEVDHERVKLWLFARLALQSWNREFSQALARRVIQEK